MNLEVEKQPPAEAGRGKRIGDTGKESNPRPCEHISFLRVTRRAGETGAAQGEKCVTFGNVMEAPRSCNSGVIGPSGQLDGS